ncbi:MAG: ComEC/Rec2 family competence protein [Pirellulales bacterium]
MKPHENVHGASRRFDELPAAGYQPLVLLAAAIALGIAANDALRLGPLPAWARPGLGCWLLATGAALAVWRRSEGLAAPRCATLGLGLAAAAVGGLWHHIYLDRYPADHLARRLGREPAAVCVEAVVEAEPRTRMAMGSPGPAWAPTRPETQFTATIRRVRAPEGWTSASGEARVFVTGKLDDVHCGDQVLLLAQAALPTPAGNPGEYDAARAERGRRRLLRLSVKSPAAVTVQARPLAWNWRRTLAELRAAGQRRLTQYVGGESAILASALLLGTRDELAPERNQAFFVTGLAHLLAISGLNVAIFAYGFWAVVRLGWFPRRGALAIVGLLAVFYALLTGADPPVVRAAILVVCVCTARFLGRQGLAYNTLAAAALAILAANPDSLFQTGTQLSFLAVGVLCRTTSRRTRPARRDALEQMLERARPWWQRRLRQALAWWWDVFATSGSVWLASLPLVVWKFHLVSPVALLLNPVVLAPTAVALYAGFFTLVTADAAPSAAAATGACCRWSLECLEYCVAWGERLPGSHVWWAGPSGGWVALFYAGLAMTPLWRGSRRASWLAGATVVVGLMGPATWWCDRSPSGAGVRGAWHVRGDRAGDQPAPWRCTFAAVGHGTAVLVESPAGGTLLYDCGRLGAPSLGARSISSVLWSRGWSSIDAVVISHADADHYNALPELLARFSIGRVYISRGMARRRDAGWAAVRDAIVARGTPLEVIESGRCLPEFTGGECRVLHPPPGAATEAVGASDNSRSLVLSLSAAGRRVLLPGDLEGDGLRSLVQQDPQPHDVLMAPHHGSARSQPEALVRWASPHVVVVSGAAGKAKSDERATADRATPRASFRPTQLHTAYDGAIHLEMSRDDVRIWTWQGRWRRR